MSIPDPRPGAAALVTGASAGIGSAIARELADRGHDLVLVARRAERLEKLAGELRAEPGVNVEVMPCDLADREARDGLPARIEEAGLEIDVLVNNAGFATGGPFYRSDPAREVDQVRVLVEAPVALCSAFTPGMVERRSGAILIVASTAAMQPLPYSAGYSAAKAHALTFAEALHSELRGRGVTVTALCPGPVDTEFWEIPDEQPIQSTIPKAAWISAADAGRAGVKGLASGRRVVVPGQSVRAAMLATRYVPHAIKLRAAERMLRRGR